jgi:multidrug resistance efflux pump
LAATFAVLAYLAWGSLFSFDAYGVVAGYKVELSPAWSGTVAEVHVAPGDTVQQGAPLLSLTSTPLSDQIAGIEDEIFAAESQLTAETARLSLQASQRYDQSHGAWADVHLLEGELEAAQAKLAEIENRLALYGDLAAHQVVTEEDITTYRLQKQGQQALVDRYAQALEQRRLRATAAASSDSIDNQLAPYRAKLQSLNNLLHRLREQQAQGTLRAPFDGKVLDIEARVGEYCQLGQNVLSLVQSGSAELVVYLPQRQASRVEPGQQAKVRVESTGKRIRCVVQRVGTHYDAPAKEVQTHYLDHQQTLPVFLIPKDTTCFADLPLGTPIELLSVRRARTSRNPSLASESLLEHASSHNAAADDATSSQPAL